MIEGLAAAVAVGETSFFRQPEHFAWIARETRGRRLRAWSAGCATGEEAWSLAATIEGEVLGTDLIEGHVAAARAGTYRPWSVRAPLPEAILEPLPDGRLRVVDRLRAAVRFRRHNLLDPAPEGGFDLILCRNVLVWFTAEAARFAIANLSAALAPGGCLLFAPLDVDGRLPGLERLRPPELQIHRRRPG